MAKKRNRVFALELQCCMCPNTFKAARDDKKTCGPKCRKALSRAHLAARVPTNAAKLLNPKHKTKCYGCGMKRDGRIVRCPICGERKTVKVKS